MVRWCIDHSIWIAEYLIWYIALPYTSRPLYPIMYSAPSCPHSHTLSLSRILYYIHLCIHLYIYVYVYIHLYIFHKMVYWFLEDTLSHMRVNPTAYIHTYTLTFSLACQITQISQYGYTHGYTLLHLFTHGLTTSHTPPDTHTQPLPAMFNRIGYYVIKGK